MNGWDADTRHQRMINYTTLFWNFQGVVVWNHATCKFFSLCPAIIDYGAAPTVPYLSQNEGLPNTAAEGEFRGHRAESPSCTNSHHALENKAQDGRKRQAVASCVNYQNVSIGGGGN